MTVKDIANITSCSIYIIDKKDAQQGVSLYNIYRYNKHYKNEPYSEYTVHWIYNDDICLYGKSLVLEIDKNEFDK